MPEYSVCVMIGFTIKASSKKEVERKVKDMVFNDVNIHDIEIEKLEVIKNL